MSKQSLAEMIRVVPAIAPIAGGSARSGDWVSLKNFERCTVVFFKGAGTAGDDPVITLRQAKDVAGTEAKELNFTRLDVKKGTLTSVGVFTTVTQAAGNTYTDDTSAEAAGLFVIEVRTEMLDRDNGFDCVQLQIPDVGTNAQLGAALYILGGARYAKTGGVSAIVD